MGAKLYLIMDGRAAFSPDDAVIIEAFNAYDDQAAKKYYRNEYNGMDAVLCDPYLNIIDVLEYAAAH